MRRPINQSPAMGGRFPAPLLDLTGDWQVDVARPPLGSLVSMAFRTIVDRMQVHMAEQGCEPIRPAHLYILRSLYPTALSVSELAERCDATKQAISQMVDSLEKLDFVHRVAHPVDGRVRVVGLSELGEQRLAAAVLAYGEVEREWAELLGGTTQMREIREAMITLVEAFGTWHRGEEPSLRPVW